MNERNEARERGQAAPMGRNGMGLRGYTGKGKIDLKSSFKKILRYSRKYHVALIVATVCTLVSTILSLVAPQKLAELTNTITNGMKSGIDLRSITVIGVTLAALYLAGQVFGVLQGLIMNRATQRMGQDFRRQLSEKINRLPMSYFHKTSTGDILSRVTNDVDTLSQSISQVITFFANAALMFMGSLIMMFITNIPLAIVAMVVGFFGVFMTSLISKKGMPYFMKQQQDLGALNGYIEEIYSGQMIVKSYNQEKTSEEKFDSFNQKLVKDGFLAQSLSGLMIPISGFVGNLVYVAVCVVGALMVLHGTGDFGTIVAFLVYVTFFTQPISRLSQSMQMLMGAAAAGDRVFSFLEEIEVEAENEKKDWNLNIDGTVVFDHVSFGYNGPEHPVIKDFSETIKPGQKIAIVGPTGAGKTTLMNLLMRFYEIDKGTIQIGGTDTRELSRKQVRDCFSMVLQDSWLFEGTLRENLTLNTEGITEERLNEVMAAVGLDHFVETLPQGYDTILDDYSTISQGQKQQIAIARVMLEDGPMLILDEATSSVDTRTELLIQQAMDTLMENKTSLVIAHRLSTIVNADLILVMKDGDIIESGTHEELLQKNGFYAELYNSQFERVA